MKKRKVLSKSLLAGALLFGLTSFSGVSYAATPMAGWYYANPSIPFVNNGGSTWYANLWTTAQTRWNNVGSVYLYTTSSTYTKAGNQNNSSAGWDGITYTSYDYNNIVTANTLWVNSYYLNQSEYTTAISDGVSTHEMGHALGLAHSNWTSSVMYPYTFYSDGTEARSNYPSSDDISTIKSLYGNLTSQPVDPNPASSAKKTTGKKFKNFVSVHPSWAIEYRSNEDMASHADLVLTGKIVKENGVEKNSPTDYSSYNTKVTMNIDEILKGNTNQKSIIISQIGGIDGDTAVVPDDSTFLRQGDEVLVFLKKADDRTYTPINGDDGVFNKSLSNNEEYVNQHNSNNSINQKEIETLKKIKIIKKNGN